MSQACLLERAVDPSSISQGRPLSFLDTFALFTPDRRGNHAGILAIAVDPEAKAPKDPIAWGLCRLALAVRAAVVIETAVEVAAKITNVISEAAPFVCALFSITAFLIMQWTAIIADEVCIDVCIIGCNGRGL